MKFICEITFPHAETTTLPVEIEALTAGGAKARIHKAIVDTFRDSRPLIFVKEVKE